MKVQELADFLSAVNPDLEAEVVVKFEGRRFKPTLSHTVGGHLLIEIGKPRLKRKQAKKIAKAYRKTERSKKVLGVMKEHADHRRRVDATPSSSRG